LQEARLSSEIENIVTTTDELYKATDEDPSKLDHATKEVLHYREALWYGFENLKARPLSTNLFIDLVGRCFRNMSRSARPGCSFYPGRSKRDNSSW